MLRRSSSTPDTGRLAEALSIPGIDPRLWVSNAVVNDDGSGNAKVRLDSSGYLVEVTLLPSGIVEVARVGTVYNGPGFGLYFPLGSGDTGLVVAPDGSPDAGLVWIPKMWSPADPPPQDAINAPVDVHLVLKQDVNLRMVTSGGGNLTLVPTGSGQVFLGGESNDSAMQPVALGKNLQDFLNDMVTKFNNLLNAFLVHGHDPGTFNVASAPVVGISGTPDATPQAPPNAPPPLRGPFAPDTNDALSQPSVEATKAQVK